MVKTLWTPNHHAHVVVRQTFATKLEARGRLECLLLLVITAKGEYIWNATFNKHVRVRRSGVRKLSATPCISPRCF